VPATAEGTSSPRHAVVETSRKDPHMRPVVLQMGITLDGFVHGAKGFVDWGLTGHPSSRDWTWAGPLERAT
jgi:hypothetical protein